MFLVYLFTIFYFDTDNKCDYYRTCTACTIPHPFPRVTLRGLCSYSLYDRTYSYSIDKSGHSFLQGDSSSLIFYESTIKTWVLWSSNTQNRVAISTAHEYSLMMGTVKFDFKDVSDDLCGKGDGNAEYVVKLTSCREAMFTCDDGRCIDIAARCDNTADCIDGSDENQCKLVSLSKKYMKSVAPFVMDQEWETKVPVDVKIYLKVDDILG